MSRLLASVNSLDEALQLKGQGVDIIDLKQPSQGALGALSVAEVTTIVDALQGGVEQISATVGDLPMQPELVANAVIAMAATGVDFVKIGFFPETAAGQWQAVIAALSQLTSQYRLIAVLFADAPLNLQYLELLAKAGFVGVMLDTMDKQRGALPELLSVDEIAEFVTQAKQRHLLTGLAGALRESHLSTLLPLQPDYLGFRGALCEGELRTARLSLSKVQAIRQRLIHPS